MQRSLDLPFCLSLPFSVKHLFSHLDVLRWAKLARETLALSSLCCILIHKFLLCNRDVISCSKIQSHRVDITFGKTL